MIRYIVLVFLLGSRAFAETSVIGVYDLEVVISDKVFHDVLEIQSRDGEKVKGTFSVPNVFSVPFSGVVEGAILSGSFLAKEGGAKFLVEMEAMLKSNGKITGQLLQQRMKFADFKGVKRGHDE